MGLRDVLERLILHPGRFRTLPVWRLRSPVWSVILAFLALTSPAALAVPGIYTVTTSVGPGGSFSPAGAARPVSAGTSITILVTANSGYTHDAAVGGTCPQGGWNGDIWSTGAITANCTVNFSFTPFPTVTPLVGVGGVAFPDIALPVSPGSAMTYAVVPDAGYTSDLGVAGACPSGRWDASGLVWTTGPITANCTVGFSFTASPTVTAVAAPGIATPATLTVRSGSTASFVITPLGYDVLAPAVGGTCAQGVWSGNTWTTGPITVDCTVTFSYTPGPIVTASAGIGGGVAFSQQQTVLGTPASIDVFPVGNYTIDTAVGGTCPQGNWSGNVWITGPITADCTVSFSFTPFPTVTAAGNGGIFDPPLQSVSPGTPAIVTAWSVGNFTLNTPVAGTCPQGSWAGNRWTTGPITLDCTVLFSFTPFPSVTPVAGPGGSIINPGPQPVSPGTSIGIRVSPATGYLPDPAVGGTCPQGSWSGNLWTTGAITADCTVDIRFIASPTVTPLWDGAPQGVVVNPPWPQTVRTGTTLSFEAKPYYYWKREALIGGTCPQGSWAGDIWTTGVITADCTVKFNYTALPVVTPSAGVGGSVNPFPLAVMPGTPAMVVVTPQAHYMVDPVVGGTCPSGSWSGNTWTTGAITADCTLAFSFTPAVTVTPSVGAGGTVSPLAGQSVAPGVAASVAVTANASFSTDMAVGGTCPQGSWSGTTWTTGAITADCTLTFSFTPWPTATPSVGAGGTVSPLGGQTVTPGAAVSVVVTADAGYATDTAVGGTCPQGSWRGTTWTTGAITADCTVGFSFTDLFCWQCLPSRGGWRAIVR